MLRGVNELKGFVLEAKDGEIGRCRDFLFDDRHWTLRYMVADTSKWLPIRKVLISPLSFESPDWQAKRFPVKLTRDQVKGSPPLEEDQPVSRQYENLFLDYYLLPYYWAGPHPWGGHPDPQGLLAEQQRQRDREKKQQHHDGHLRSIDEVDGYRIQAADGQIGHVEDFLVEDDTWTIRYLVVDTRAWLPGRKVLIASDWIDDVSWPDRKVYVSLKQRQIEESPEHDPGAPVARSYEESLYAYYAIPPYWRRKVDKERLAE